MNGEPVTPVTPAVDNTPATAAPEPASGPAPAAPVSHQGSSPPPAATVVLNGNRSEREIELEAQLETERQTRRQREMRVNELEDENRQLKIVTPRREPKQKKSGWVLLDTEEN